MDPEGDVAEYDDDYSDEEDDHLTREPEARRALTREASMEPEGDFFDDEYEGGIGGRRSGTKTLRRRRRKKEIICYCCCRWIPDPWARFTAFLLGFEKTLTPPPE